MSRGSVQAMTIGGLLAAAIFAPLPAAAIINQSTINPQIHLHVQNELLRKTPRIHDKLRLKIICHDHRERTEPYGNYVTVKTCGPA